MDVMNLKNIAHHHHEIEALLIHAHKHEKDTGYYVLISFDANDNELGKSTFLNFTKEYKEP